MSAKLFLKSIFEHHSQRSLSPADLDPRVTLHYGIPSTASILAFDPIQSLLAIGTLDGRIKVIGGDNIEALLISPRQLPFKHLQFLQNQGFLASISNENEILVWDLLHRQIACTLQWESNITAFSVIDGTTYMYIGCEYGMVSVLKYDAEGRNITQLPYCVSTNIVAEAAGLSLADQQPIAGVLHQPCSQGNRFLIAYQNGLMVLWDASEDRTVIIRGYEDLLLKDKTVVHCPKDTRHEQSDDVSDDREMDKEISSLCWASNNGSVLAVGYVDGDIMFWNLLNTTATRDQKAEKSFNNVVKLQLSSSSRRLPVIVLHWAMNRSTNDCEGQLFVYGGDEVGSEEVLTILSLDWSPGIESMKCIGRVDLTLDGFADMVLLPSAGRTENGSMSLVVLTSPGKLHIYDNNCLSALISQKEKKTSAVALQYHMIIPTLDPYMTVVKLGLVSRDGKFSKGALAAKLYAAHTPDMGGTKWPLTGGVPSQLLDSEERHIERLYIAGYKDGSVRVWDATYPVLSLIYLLGSEVNGINIAGTSASISALDFCSETLSLAIGNECGLVLHYKLMRSSDDTILHFVTETENEVHNVHQGEGPHCSAVFSLINSCICTLQFTNFGSRLAVGYECGRVAVLDIITQSVLFVTECVTNSSAPVISLTVKTFSDTDVINSPENSESKTSKNLGQELVFVMTSNAHIIVMDSETGKMVSSWSMNPEKNSAAISMYIIDGTNFIPDVSNKKHSLNSHPKSEDKGEFAQSNLQAGSTAHEVQLETSSETACFGLQLMSLFFLLCSEDALLLYHLKSTAEDDREPIGKVSLVKPCCWTSTFKKDEKECGLVVLYQSGVIEIRSLPTLEVLRETSLMSILRWNFETNREKTMFSSHNGQIILVNGCELAAISILANENDFRIPESLPSLRDKVLQAPVDASIITSPNQKNKQDAVPGLLGGMIKTFKAIKEAHNADLTVAHKNNFLHFESLFSTPPFFKPPAAGADDQDMVELNIDDIKIDEPMAVSSSFQKSNNNERAKGTEKERLFEGASTETTPRLRTAEEIKAKYRKAGDTSSAAAQARDKLVERKEKLERLSQRTEELKSGAEDFASMASELAKRMERRKWWNI